MSQESESDALDPLASNTASEPLVPILHLEVAQSDPVALATWLDALSNTLAVEVPHDLLGLWLYPTQGGAVLLGPSELAADDLAVPVPSPHLKPEQLTQVESIVLGAGYGSVACLPIRFGRRDVALMLVADLRPDQYGPVPRVVLQCVSQQVAPMLGRIARQWKPVEAPTSRQQERIAGLLETLVTANQNAATPQRFVTTISRGLVSFLPHEHIELVVSDADHERYFRLGEHPGGRLWTDPSLVISAEHLNLDRIFESQTRLLVGDIYEDARWPRGFLTANEAGADVRGLVGACVGLTGGIKAYLWVGSVGPELYGEDDAELLGLLAGLITPQVEAFLRAGEPAAEPVTPTPQPSLPPSSPSSSPSGISHAELLFRIAGLLATTTDPAVATQLIAAEAATALPFDKLTFVLRMTQTDRVILVEPGERRPLASLPLVSVGESALALTLRGNLPCAFAHQNGESRMVVPLRVAGRIHGAMIFSATAPNALTEQHVVTAQHLADIVAAHLELLRRTAMVPQPSIPRWRKADRTGASRDLTS
ncbi:MAG TPA: GAF domain-containing protein [Gemmatimonadales bacterium]